MSRNVFSPFFLSSIPSLIPKLLVDLCGIASRLYALTFPARGWGVGWGPLCWERQINHNSLWVLQKTTTRAGAAATFVLKSRTRTQMRVSITATSGGGIIHPS